MAGLTFPKRSRNATFGGEIFPKCFPNCPETFPNLPESFPVLPAPPLGAGSGSGKREQAGVL